MRCCRWRRFNPVAIKIFNIKGRRPSVAPRLLELGYAQIASNVVLGSGAMGSVKSLGSSVASVSSPKTIYKFLTAWLSFANRAWLCPAAISGADRLLICTGGASPYSYPVQLDTSGNIRRWGVVRPTTALSISFHGTPTDAIVQDTVSYVYTLVTAYGEESDIFTATAETDVLTGQYIGLFNWSAWTGNKSSLLSSTGNDYQYVRVYRLAADAPGNAEYQRVSLRSTPTGTAYADIPVASISAVGTRWYDVNSAQNGLSQDLGAVLETKGWDPPPAAMKNGLMFANGMYAGSIGKLVYLSMPGFYYAFPASGTMDYTVECAYDVVAMAAHNDAIIVGTTGFPAVISGTDPAFMTLSPLTYQQPCLSAKGMTATPEGVVYVSPDGLFMVGSSGGKVLTANVFDRDAWQALSLSTTMLVYFNQRIYIFFEGGTTGLVYDPALDYVYDLALGFAVKDVWVDPVADVLYLASASGVFAWDGGSGNLAAVWKSGIMETPPVNFPAMRVEGTFPSGHSTVLTYYVDGVLKHTQTVTGDEPFRLPSGFRGRDHEIQIAFSGSTINALYLGQSIEDLRNV